MTVEVFTSHGTTERRRELADRLLTEILAAEEAPESVLVGARAFIHVLVHEPAVWVTSGPDAPRYLVRITVPGSWNGKEFGDHIIPKVTDIVASFEDDPGRLYREPHCVVQIVGLREYSVGTLGRATGSTEITRLMTENFRRSGEQVSAPAGSVVDPVCGMVVKLATATLTFEHEGTTYAFCAPSCRKVFAEEHAIPA